MKPGISRKQVSKKSLNLAITKTICAMYVKKRFSGVFFFLLLGIANTWAQPELRRVEPAFWWSGMQQTQLQLMVYGRQISDLRPVVNYPGVRLIQATSVENPNYLFIDLDLAGAKPGTFEIQFQEKGKTRLVYAYRLLERQQTSAQRKGFSPADVMYLITPDRFANGDPSNDSSEGMQERLNRSFKGGRHGGDIKGIIERLDYIANMGFTAIWLNPLLENNMREYSYHGYSITDFYKVDPRFGSNALYLELIQKAHTKGVKVIMDMILNHCGSEHWWMKDLPAKDWINFGGQFVPTNHRRETIQDPYASAYDSKRNSDGWFVETMPDLNQRNKLLATYLIQNTIWWIEYADLDGIRMDTYPYPDIHFMADWNEAVLKEYPHFNVVGEEWSGNPAQVSFWQSGKVNPNGYVSKLPSLMDFPLQEAVRDAMLQSENGWESGFVRIYRILASDYLYPHPNNLVVFPDNHDMDRFFTAVKENLNWFRQGLAFLLTTRGTPQIYYGTEILMTNTPNGDHGIIRTDFPGGWPGDKTNGFTGQGLPAKASETQQWLKKFLQWRKTATAIHDGKLLHFVPEQSTYVTFRFNTAQKLMIVLNKNEQPFSLKLDRFQEALLGATTARDVFSGTVYPLNPGTLPLPPGEPLILEIY
jgi:glycosidase